MIATPRKEIVPGFNYYKYDGNAGLRFFRMEMKTDGSIVCTQAIEEVGEVKKGRGHMQGVVRIGYISILGNYWKYLMPSRKEEWEGAVERILFQILKV